eukprot:2496016-Amphidinium_carterae.1
MRAQSRSDTRQVSVGFDEKRCWELDNVIHLHFYFSSLFELSMTLFSVESEHAQPAKESKAYSHLSNPVITTTLRDARSYPILLGKRHSLFYQNKPANSWKDVAELRGHYVGHERGGMEVDQNLAVGLNLDKFTE